MARQILTDADREQLKRSLDDLNEVEEMIRQAERAGLDVSAQKERAQQARSQIIRIRQAFFPGQT